MTPLLEELRLQAERETADASQNRRPSWAPALVLGPELLDVCRALGLIRDTGKPVARLWALFADPKRIGTWQRNNLSNVPLHGHRVRGFQLVAGEQRTGSNRLYHTQKNEGDHWGEGPFWHQPYPIPSIKLGNIERSIEMVRRFLEDPISDDARRRYESTLAEEEARLVVETARLAAEHERAMERYRLHKRSFELGKARLAEFLGDPEAQMRAGSQVTGKCSRCGAILTDPISVERGIGPECVKRVAWHRIVPAEALR